MTAGVQEATPLVYKGTMYLPNPADVTQAINGASGAENCYGNTAVRCRTISASTSRDRR